MCGYMKRRTCFVLENEIKTKRNEASNTDIQRALEEFVLYDLIFEGNGGLLV